MIATGSALTNEMYEGIHDRNMSLPPLAEDADVDCADDTPSADAFDSLQSTVPSLMRTGRKLAKHCSRHFNAWKERSAQEIQAT